MEGGLLGGTRVKVGQISEIRELESFVAAANCEEDVFNVFFHHTRNTRNLKITQTQKSRLLHRKLFILLAYYTCLQYVL